MDDFIKFEDVTFFSAYLDAKTRNLFYIDYGNSVTSPLMISVKSEEQFERIRKILNFKKEYISLDSCPGATQLLTDVITVNAAFAMIKYVYDDDVDISLVAIYDSTNNSFYCLEDNKFYTKKALFYMCKSVQEVMICDRIKELSDELIELSKVTYSE